MDKTFFYDIEGQYPGKILYMWTVCTYSVGFGRPQTLVLKGMWTFWGICYEQNHHKFLKHKWTVVVFGTSTIMKTKSNTKYLLYITTPNKQPASFSGNWLWHSIVRQDKLISSAATLEDKKLRMHWRLTIIRQGRHLQPLLN